MRWILAGYVPPKQLYTPLTDMTWNRFMQITVPTPTTIPPGVREYGTGFLQGLSASQGQTIIGPWQTVDREQLRIKVHARSTAKFNLNYEFSTDKGTTWYVGEQIASSTSSHDDGANLTQLADGHFNVGYWWRIGIFNTDPVAASNTLFEWRFHSY